MPCSLDNILLSKLHEQKGKVMKVRIIKLISVVVLITCLIVGTCTTSYADTLGGAGLLGSALSSLGVDLLASGGATMATLAPWLSSDFSIKGALTGVADGYIKVKDDSVIIDGVEYQSIFLDPSMATELHTQAFDFITQKAITSNSTGMLAEGYGYFDGIPVFVHGQNYFSQAYTLPQSGNVGVGNTTVSGIYEPNNLRTVYTLTLSNGSQTTAKQIPTSRQPGYVKIVDYSYGLYDSNNNLKTSIGIPQSLQVIDSFQYDYVAGTIDATPLPSTYGFTALVPSAELAQAGIIVGTYPVDGGTGTDAINEIIDLLDKLYGEEAIAQAEFAEEDNPPVPPTPVPTTALGEVPYSEFLDTFGQSVTDGLQDVNDTIGLYGEDIIDTVDTVGQSITDELQNVGDVVDTVGQSIVDELENVETGIDTLGQTITNALDDAIDNVLEAVDSIASTLDEVIEAIQTHPLDLFSNFLDRLANIPIIRSTFDGIKRHVGIWHYVVEWLTCVGGFLGFMIGVFTDTAYCMVVPIYACVAAAICLAFYKRFGR